MGHYFNDYEFGLLIRPHVTTLGGGGLHYDRKGSWEFSPPQTLLYLHHPFGLQFIAGHHYGTQTHLACQTIQIPELQPMGLAPGPSGPRRHNDERTHLQHGSFIKHSVSYV